MRKEFHGSWCKLCRSWRFVQEGPPSTRSYIVCPDCGIPMYQREWPHYDAVVKKLLNRALTPFREFHSEWIGSSPSEAILDVYIIRVSSGGKQVDVEIPRAQLRGTKMNQEDHPELAAHLAERVAVLKK